MFIGQMLIAGDKVKINLRFAQTMSQPVSQTFDEWGGLWAAAAAQKTKLP